MAYTYTPLPILSVTKARLIGNVVLVFLTVLVVALRFVARVLTGSKLGWDDYLTLLCLPQGIGLLVCQGLFSTAGAGYSEAVAQVNVTFLSILIVPFELFYATCAMTSKLSVLFFYLRVFTSNGMRRATTWMMILTVVWGVANLLQSLFVCRVHHGRLEFTNKSQCNDELPSFIASGLFNGMTNLIITFLPLYTIWSLTVTVSTRMGLTTVFLLGLNVTWVSIVRIELLVQTIDSNEVFKAIDPITFLSVLEVNLSILCNSLPMLLPLYSYWRYRKFFGAGEDEYVSRVRGDKGNHSFLVQNVANGLPLETIYGKENVHFTATVMHAPPSSQDSSGEPKHSMMMGRRASSPNNEGGHWLDGDSESTRRLSRNAGVITIETKWTITESRKSDFDLD